MTGTWLTTWVRASELWSAWMLAMSWQVAVLVLALAVAGYFLRHRSARFRYALWTLIPLRLVLPPTLAFVTGWAWWVLPQEPAVTVAVPAPPSATTSALVSRHDQSESMVVDPVMFASSSENLLAEPDQPAAVMLPVDSLPVDANPAVLPAISTRQRWQLLLSTCWLLVVASLLCRLALGYRRVRAMVRSARPVGPELEMAFADCCRAVGTRRKIGIRISNQAWTPLLIGIWRPVIVLPPMITTKLSSSELHAVLVHELQHVVRHDAAMHLFQSLLNILYWFHPLVWLASRQICRLRELACDEATVAALAGERRDYGSSLIKVAETLVPPIPASHLALGMAESSQQVIHRVRRILDPRLPVGSRLSRASLSGLIVAALFLIPSGARGPVAVLAEPVATQSAVNNQPNVTSPSGTEPLVLRGRVVDADKQPVVNAAVTFRYYRVPNGNMESSATTDALGRFTISVHASLPSYAFTSIEAKSVDGSQLGITPLFGGGIHDEPRDHEIALKHARPIRLMVVDQHGTPIPGAGAAVQTHKFWSAAARTDDTGAATLYAPEDEHIEAVVAWQDGKGLDYLAYPQPEDDSEGKLGFPASGDVTLVLDGTRPMVVRAVNEHNQPLAGIGAAPWLLKKESQPRELNLQAFRQQVFSQQTDKDGSTTFDWMPHWQLAPLSVLPLSRNFVNTEATYDPLEDAGQLTMRLVQLVPIRGRVTFPDGSPAAGIRIAVGGAGNEEVREPREDDRNVTDADGRYELLVPPQQIYLVVVRDKQWAAAPRTGFVVNKGEAVVHKDFLLGPATRVHGRLIDEESGEPLVGQYVSLWQHGIGLESMPDVKLPNPKGRKYQLQPNVSQSTITDQAGQFEFQVGSGSFTLKLPAHGNEQKFSITDEPERELVVRMRLKEQKTFTGTVVTGDPPRPVAGAKVTGIPTVDHIGREWQADTNSAGTFQVKLVNEPMLIKVTSADHSLSAIARLDGRETKFTMLLKPVTSIRGRLVAAKTGRPIPGSEIAYGIRVNVESMVIPTDRLDGTVITAEDGTFQIDHLVVGEKYHVYFCTADRHVLQETGRIITPTEEVMQLGDVQQPPPAPKVSAVMTAFNVAGTPLERYRRDIEFIKVSDQRLLVVFGDPTNSKVRELIAAYNSDALRDEFCLLPVPISPKRLGDALPLAGLLGENLERNHGGFLLVIMDQDGNKLATAGADQLSADGVISQGKVNDWLQLHKAEPRTAHTLLNAALKRATEENRRLLVLETATWSRPTRMFMRYLAANRQWQQDYILVNMNDRRPGASELMQGLGKETSQDLPWFAILDAHGNVLSTSSVPQTRRSIGYPYSATERSHFQAILTATRQRMTDQEIGTLIGALEQAAD